MNNFKKSQAALEFLTTYGWAFLVILIIIFALSYFGIFDIKDIITPNKCTLAPGLTCSDFKIGSEAVQIVLTNNLGEDITISDIELNNCQGQPSSSSPIIKNNQMGSFTVGLCAITEKRYDTDVNITYMGESEIEHTIKGEMTARNEFAEISYDYLGAGAGSGEGSFAGIKAAYDFNENDGYNLTDISNNGNDGTIYGNTVLLMDFEDGTANDKSIYNNDGSLQNGVTCNVAGVYGNGKGCSFDGVAGTYINVPRKTSIEPANYMTIEAWVNPQSYAGLLYPRIVDKSCSGGGYYLLIDASIENKVRWDIEAYGFIDSVSGIPTNEWSHIAATYDGSSMKIYINGDLDKEASASTGAIPHCTTTDLKIGGLTDTQRTLNGLIDEVAVYSKALTEEEIWQHYTAQKAKFTDWETGRYGSALSFDRINDYVSIGNVLTGSNTPFTAEAWINPSETTSSWKTVFAEGCTGFDLTILGATLYFGRNCGGSNGVFYAGPTVNANEWTHVAIVYDGTNIDLYKNGAKTPGGPVNYVHAPLYIGTYNGATELFHGLIDSVAIYDRALSAEEIALHAGS